MGPSPDAPISRVFHVKVLSEDSDRPRPYQARQPLHPLVCAILVCGLLTAWRVSAATVSACHAQSEAVLEPESSRYKTWSALLRMITVVG